MTPHPPPDRAAAAAAAAATTAADAADAQTRALLAVVDELRSELQPHPVPATLDATLERDLGLDSLARVELLLRIEKAFGTKLPEHTLVNAHTLRDLQQALAAAPAGPGAVPMKTLAGDAPQAIEAPPPNLGTLPDLLAWHAEHHAERLHLIYQAETGAEQGISYGRLHHQAQRVAANLQAQGIDPGQSVALMLPTGPAYFACFMGILLAGAVPVPIYPPARMTQIEDHFQRHAGILANAEAVALVTAAEAHGLVQLLTGRIAGLRQVVTPEELLRRPAGPATRHAARPEATAFLQYTSGSTGNPKGVVLSHANVLANLRAMGRATRVDSRDVFVSWLPLYHDMGLIGAWFGSLYHGFPLVVMSPFTFLSRPERWLWAIHRHRGTLSAAPNFAYELCLRKLDDAALEGLDLASLRWLFNGSEAVSAETMRAFADRFARYGLRPGAIAPVYGLAECSVGLAFPPADRGLKVDTIDRDALVQSGNAVPAADRAAHPLRFVACGRPLPDHEVRIVDPLGHELGERQEGRLEFRGPSTTRGYFRNPEKTAALIRDGWLDSGDLAYIADGDLYLTGRIKDLIIRGGRHIYPQEIEETVGALPGVRKGCVAAFGCPDPATATEQLVVLAETRETDPAKRTQLHQAINAAVFDLLGLPPDQIVLGPAGAVLKTSSGKIRRSATRERYQQGLAMSPRPVWQQVLRLGWRDTLPLLRRGARLAGELAFAGYAWLVLALLAPIAWLTAVLLPRPAWSWAASRWISRLFFRLCTSSFTVQGLDHLPPGQPCVLAINHQSYLDGLAIVAALPRPVRFVAKQELRRHLVPRLFLQSIGTEFVERFDVERGIEDAERLTELVKVGRSLAFFPEGTFTRAPGLRPFRLGAFAAAAAAHALVVPVTLRGTRAILHDGEWFPHAGPVEITIGAPIAPDGTDWEAAVRLRERVRQEILGHCGEPDLA